MGNSGEKIQGKFKSIYYKTKTHKSTIGKNVSCPTCGRVFNAKTTYNTLNVHLDSCLQGGGGINAGIIGVGSGLIPNGLQRSPINHDSFADNMMSSEEEVFIWKKVPVEGSLNEFKWTKVPFKEITNYAEIKKMTVDKVKSLPFEEKEVWFRYQMEKIRVPWTEGSLNLELSKEKIVEETYLNLEKFNLYKEIKISFKGEKVLDAGGLMREWIHLINIELFRLDENKGMFVLADSDEIVYKLNPDYISNGVKDAVNRLQLFGEILGKSLFERIPIGATLDRTLLKHLLNEKFAYEDLKFYDKQLASSFDYILNNSIDGLEDLEQYFVFHKKSPQGVINEIELKPGGKNIRVTDQNKKEYTELYIELVTTKLVQKSLELIKKGFKKVIPPDTVEVFTSMELEMIINGLPFIDIDEWEENTEYKGAYYKNHQVIKWFWVCLREFDQKKLSRFLKFCTGSSRVPIEGFRLLESNRGKISKFCIESSKFTKENPYPKAHTCFNRLELPMYSSFDILKQYIYAVAENDLEGMFGME